MALLELDPLAGERIGLLGRVEVGLSGVRLVVDLVNGRTACLGFVGVVVPLAPLLLDHPLPKGSTSRLVSRPVLSDVDAVLL